MFLQTRSEYARARLISESPLTFELAFDAAGHSGFSEPQTILVQLATRHIVSDICELRQGVQSPWGITQSADGILLQIETYGWFKERLELKANPERAAIEVSYRLEFMQPYEAHEIGTLLLRPAEDPRLPVVYLAGRQGVCPLQETVQHEVLVDSQAPLAGWLQKGRPEKSFWLVGETGVAAIVDWTRGEPRTWVGLTPQVVPGWQYAHYPATRTAWPAPLKFQAGQQVEYHAAILNGRLSEVDAHGLLVAGRTDFLPDELEFIYASTILGTLRPYTPEQHWFNRTALAIHHVYARFYDWSWIRDDAHGYLGSLSMAGSLVHASLADEISTWLKAPLSEHGNYPHNNGLAFWEGGDLWKVAWASNLDTPAWLVSMTYSYLAQTGDWEFARQNLGDLLRAGQALDAIIARNPHRRCLPWIDQDSDTYMDMNVIRGEQTYLAALTYQGLVQLGWIISRLSGAAAGQPFFDLAAKLKQQANLPASEGGLWDGEAGVYFGWRDPQGALEPRGGHETYSNLLASACGLCDDPARRESILAWLNSHWDAIYTVDANPMTHSDVAYWQKEDGQRHGIPWITGWDIRARFASQAARRYEVWNLYRRSYATTDYPYLECAWPGQTIETLEREHSNRGRVWDSWAFPGSVWGVHLGLQPDLGHLRLQPVPLEPDSRPSAARFNWQGHRYELLVSGSGKSLSSPPAGAFCLRVNGDDWPSAILPPQDARLEATLDEKPSIPWLDQASPLVSLHRIAFDPVANELRAELSSSLPGTQFIHLSLPAGWNIQSIQADVTAAPLSPVDGNIELGFNRGRTEIKVRFCVQK